MEWTTIALLIVLKVVILILIFRKRKPNKDQALYARLDELQGSITRIESGLKEALSIVRKENRAMSDTNLPELKNTLEGACAQTTRILKTHDNPLIPLDLINRQIHQQLKELARQADKDTPLLRDKLEQEFMKFHQAIQKNGQGLNQQQGQKFVRLEDKPIQ